MSEVPGESTRPSRKFTALDIALLVFFLVYAAILIFPPWHFFLELWDESRNANNALEMAAYGHWSTAYFNGAPDHWNTKPLLLIWIIAGLIKIGIPVHLALRLPSGIAAMATVATLYIFCRQRLARPLAAVFSSLLLLSTIRFFGYHVAVSGDFDALLTFFVTLYLLACWLYLEAEPPLRSRWLLLTFIAMSCAIATKGIASMMVMPGLLLFVLVSRKLKQVLTDPRVWLTTLAVIAFTAALYGIREHFDPGYVNAVWHNEISGRYAVVNEGNTRPPLFYVKDLLTSFEPGLLAVFLGVYFLARRQFARGVIRSAALFGLIVPTAFLLVISFSKTKLLWYSAPALPLYCIPGGLAIDSAIAFLSAQKPTLSRLATCVTTVTLMVIASVTLYRAEGPVRLGRATAEEPYHALLDDMQHQGMSGPIVIYDEGEKAQKVFPNYLPIGLFYADLARLHGQQVTIIGPGDALPIANWLITCDPALIKSLLPASPNFVVRSMDGCLVTATGAETSAVTVWVPQVSLLRPGRPRIQTVEVLVQ